jgi:hypothetical protein
VSEACDVGTVGSLLGDPTVRTILVETSQEPMTAPTVSDHCDVSRPTVSRRLEDPETVICSSNVPAPPPMVATTAPSTRQSFGGSPSTSRPAVSGCPSTARADRFTRLVEGM